jgi:hypothetical protein
VSRTALGPTQPPIQWVPGALSLGVKRQGREADHSPPFSAEVNNARSYISTPPIPPSWRGAQLKCRDNFTFTFTSILILQSDSHCFNMYQLCLLDKLGFIKQLQERVSTFYTSLHQTARSDNSQFDLLKICIKEL